MSSLKTLHEKGQSIWFDSISRDMLEDGTIARYASELSVTVVKEKSGFTRSTLMVEVASTLSASLSNT